MIYFKSLTATNNRFAQGRHDVFYFY